MQIHSRGFLAFALALASLPHAEVASAAPAVVQLRQSCDGGWCYENLADLGAALWSPPQSAPWYPGPSATSPVSVEIGPGSFEGSLDCPLGKGWVSFRGASRTHSRLVNPTWTTVFANDCSSLDFQDLRIESGVIAVSWTGGGSSTWTDVDVQGGVAAWFDTGCSESDPPEELAEHLFSGVRLQAGSIAVGTSCGRSAFYGGEILTLPVSTSIPPVGGFLGVAASLKADVRVYGSAIRVSTRDLTQTSASQATGVKVGNATGAGRGKFSMHGGIINVTTSNLSGVNATGLLVQIGSGGDAFATTPETAFVVEVKQEEPPSATARRTDGDGTIDSPFLWQAGDAPPPVESQTGNDLYVETDCDDEGCDGGTDPHLLIYDSRCAGKPWFDVVRNQCRDE